MGQALREMGYNVPTFDDFRLNREKYIGSPEDILTCADKSVTNFRAGLMKQTYEYEGYAVDSLEKMQTLFKEEGIVNPEKELEMKPEMIPEIAGNFRIVVRFRRKSSLIRVES